MDCHFAPNEYEGENHMKESSSTRIVLKKALSTLLTATIVTSTVIMGAGTAYASDTLPYLGESARGVNQPYEHGYRTVDLKNWAPETDPFSEFMRAQIPLQARNNAFGATQANPKLNADTQMFTLAGDYGNAFFDSYQYTNEFSQYLFNYWQYTDYYGSWHGMPTIDVPESMYISERGVTDAWKNRKFEFGIINMPNPGYTNAAHKNGVKSIGCIFLPRTGQNHKDFLKQDKNGNFPYADKLAEMCKWYGFDGWFINQEEGISASDIPLYKQFMKQMLDQEIYIQWYDSVVSPSGGVSYQNEFNESNSGFVKDSGESQVSDSIFLNYWWDNSKLKSSADHAKSLGLNPLTTVFAGIEAGGGRWNQPYDLRNNLDANGQPMNAIASLGSEFVHDGLDEDLDGGANNNIEMRREKDDYQWMTFQRERMWWTGLTQDPTSTPDQRRNSNLANPQIGVNTGDKWDGVSAYIAERSVINGDTFVTNFNTGHGLEYAKNGTVSNSHEWSNIVIQDILPTWQWWQQTSGTKLAVDYDYGTKYKKTLEDKSSGTFPYQLVGAYNGGSSLVVSGKLDANDFLHLYKTDLDVNANSKMAVTFKKSSSDAAQMKLGVIFADDTNTVVKLDIANSVAKSDSWITSSVDLSGYAGKKIAAFGLEFSGTSDQYQMNIGQMRYTSNLDVKPAAPANLEIQKAFGTNAKEMVLKWDIAPYDEVKQYNVYADINGKEMYMGGTYDSTFYIKSLYDANSPVTIKLKAVSADGTESDAATAVYDYSKAVTGVAVTPTETALNVTWQAPAGVELGTTDIKVVKAYSDDTMEYTATSASGATAVSVPVSVKDGSLYSMVISPKDKNGNALSQVTYDGKFIDKICNPYDGAIRSDNRSLTIPSATDWYKMNVTPVNDGQDGKTTTIIRSQAEMPKIDSTADGVKVTLEDYAGNKSDSVTIPNCLSVIVSPSNAKVQASQSQQFTAKVKKSVSDTTVTWSVEGAKSAATKVSSQGLLTLGSDETASSIKVKATSNEDSSVSDSVTVTVLPVIILYSDSTSVYGGETQQFTVKNLGTSMPASDFDWTASASYGKLKEGTSINPNGLLTVDPAESAYSIKITAKNKANSAMVLTTSVSVKKVYAITGIENGVFKGYQSNLKVQYKGDDTSAADYTWSIEGAGSPKTTIADGVLVVSADESAYILTITATKKSNTSITVTASTYVFDPNKITAVTPLEDTIKTQTVSYNTPVSELNLPNTINASVDYGYGGPYPEDISGVTWTSNPDYDPTHPGNYVFTAKLPSGYILQSGIEAPKITVTVQAAPVTVKTITEFTPLTNSVKLQKVAVGTLLAALVLPNELNATVNAKQEKVSGVTWTSSPTYNPQTPGTYTFSAKLPDGYTIGGGTTAPNIQITVAAVQPNQPGHNNNSGNTKVISTYSPVDIKQSGKTTMATFDAQPDSPATVSQGQASMTLTVPAETMSVIASASADHPAELKIALPVSAVIQQLNTEVVRGLELSVKVPHEIVVNGNSNAKVSIAAVQPVLQAAKNSGKDVIINVLDSQSGNLAYSWKFFGSALKASAAPATNVDLALTVTQVKDDLAAASAVAANAPDLTVSGIVLKFANNGLLPGPATVRIYVGNQQGCTPHSKVYAYYLNHTVNQLESLPTSEYTVDKDGFISITIGHCSDYVVLPKAAAKVYQVKSDTTYPVSVKQGNLYTFAVTVNGSTVPKLTVGNGTLFSSTLKKKGNKYYLTVKANDNTLKGMTALYSTLSGQKPVVLCYLSKI